MSSFEWLEVESINSEIALARERLVAARASHHSGRIRALQQEITAAEARRDKLLAYISTNLANDTEIVARAKELQRAIGSGETAAPEAAMAAPPSLATAPAPITVIAAEPADRDPVTAAAIAAEAQQPVAKTTAALQAIADDAGSDVVTWSRLTPRDLRQAKQRLDRQQAEILARHADELARLNADEAKLELLEQAITAFAQRFAKDSAAGGANAERGLPL